VKGQLLTVREVAERLGRSRWTVYRLARLGVLPHIKLGRAVRFDAEVLEEFLERGGYAWPGAKCSHAGPCAGPAARCSGHTMADEGNRDHTERQGAGEGLQ